MLSPPWKAGRRAMFAALGETYFPPMFAGDSHGGDATSMAIMEAFYRNGAPIMRLAFWAAMWGVELTPLFTIGRFKRFSRLHADDRLRHLRIISRQPWFAPLRPLASLAFFSRADTVAELGYSNAGRQ